MSQGDKKSRRLRLIVIVSKGVSDGGTNAIKDAGNILVNRIIQLVLTLSVVGGASVSSLATGITATGEY